MLAPHAGAHTERDSLSKKQLISAKNVALHFCESDTPQQAKSMTYLTSPRSNCRRWVKNWRKVKKHSFVEELFGAAHGKMLGLSVTARKKEFAKEKAKTG